jgi:hypothetical protein
LFFYHLEKVSPRENCTEMVQLSEFCPSSHSGGHLQLHYSGPGTL